MHVTAPLVPLISSTDEIWHESILLSFSYFFHLEGSRMRAKTLSARKKGNKKLPRFCRYEMVVTDELKQWIKIARDAVV